jgi:OHCU decarboxylase
MNEQEFIARYAGIYEHSPWVAEGVASIASDITDVNRIAELMADCVDNADSEKQMTLIRAHPDLAGKAQIAGELTAESTEEQTSAGLHKCTRLEYERFQALNESYKEKFGFPFVMAVRGSSCAEILEVFSKRLKNDETVEFETALAEIHKIARLRLGALKAKA